MFQSMLQSIIELDAAKFARLDTVRLQAAGDVFRRSLPARPIASRGISHGASHGSGQRDVKLFDREAHRLAASHLEAANLNVRGLVAQIPEVRGRVQRGCRRRVSSQRKSLAKEGFEVVSQQVSELLLALKGPPQALLGEVLLKLQHQAALVGLFFGFELVSLLIKVEEDLGAALLLPGFIRRLILMLRTRQGISHRCAVPLPQNPDKYVALGDAQDGVNQRLWTASMEAGKGIRLPAGNFQHEVALVRHAAIDLAYYRLNGIPLGLNVGGRSNDES